MTKQQITNPVVKRSTRWMAIAAICLLTACSDTANKPPQTNTEQEPEGLQITKMNARIYLGDKLETTIQSDKAILEMEKMELHLEKVAVDFQQDGKVSNKVYSQTGLLYLSDRPEEGIGRNDLELGGGVKIESSNGMRVKTPVLRYSQQDEKIETGGGHYEQVFQNEGSVLKITGKRLEANRDMTNIVHHGAKISQTSN